MNNIELKQTSFRWLISNSKAISIVLVVFLAGCFALFQLSGRSSKKNFKEFLIANNLFTKWKENQLDNKDALDKLKKIIEELPQLKTKFEPAIAKQLLISQSGDVDSSLAAKTLKRIQKDQPYFSQFGYTTILISNNAYQDALEQAEKLKKNLDNDAEFWEKQSSEGSYGHVLYAFNLLRLALLQKTVGSIQGEFLAWNELEKRAGWHDTDNIEVSLKEREAYALLEQNFQDSSVSLKDWIQYRKHLLTENF